jgi:large conductance mechanosensitive channel
MSFRDEFKAFLMKGNVVDLAVAVVIGGAFGKIVTAFVDGIVMPLVGYALPSGDWKLWQVGKFEVGKVLGATVDFVVVALVVFVVLVKGLGALSRLRAAPPPPAPPAPDSRACPWCLETIPAAARRCRHCTADVGATSS